MTDVRRDARRPGPWVVALIGLGLLAVLLALALPSRREPTTLPPPPPPFLPVPSAEAPPAVTTAPTAPPVSAASSRPPSPERSSARPVAPSRVRPATPPPPEVTVTGRYRVVDSFGDGFIGEVLVVNATDRDRDWTVRLRFPDNVGALRTSWVEAAPQATLATAGDVFTWSSGVPVGARSRVALRFHFARSGSGDRPLTCTVNGANCDR
jgi:hypothetical protein